jgi:hypothetical protein
MSYEDGEKLHNEDLHNLYSKFNALRVIKKVRKLVTTRKQGEGNERCT